MKIYELWIIIYYDQVVHAYYEANELYDELYVLWSIRDDGTKCTCATLW